MSLLIEAVVVGVVLGVVMALGSRVYAPVSALEFAVFGVVLGALVHYAFELSGANRWYCTHGAACL